MSQTTEKEYSNKPWTLQEAHIFIKKIEPIAEAYGWSLCLHGSILYDGASKNDIDILAVSRNRTENLPNETDFVAYFIKNGWNLLKTMHLPDRNMHVFIKHESNKDIKVDLSFIDMTQWKRKNA